MNKNAVIYIAGHRGLVGSAILRKLKLAGYQNLLLRTHSELDLTNQAAVAAFFHSEKPDYVILAAAKVGGIYANNTYPADFIYSNLIIECNIIHAAYEQQVSGLLFLGSSCIYPKFAEQPMREEALLTGELESTNEPYAVAKIAGIKLCESYNRQHGMDFRSVMPTNLYGPNDNFHPKNSHVIPALLRRFHEAKENGADSVTIWGTGNAKREFMYVDDLADACLFVMQSAQPMLSHINIGTGTEVTIRELAETIKQVTGFQGELRFDSNQPDGTPRKLLDVSKINALGWQAKIGLLQGLSETYRWFSSNPDSNQT